MVTRRMYTMAKMVVLILFIIVIFSLLIAPILPYDIRSYRFGQGFKQFLIFGSPIVVL